MDSDEMDRIAAASLAEYQRVQRLPMETVDVALLPPEHRLVLAFRDLDRRGREQILKHSISMKAIYPAHTKPTLAVAASTPAPAPAKRRRKAPALFLVAGGAP